MSSIWFSVWNVNNDKNKPILHLSLSHLYHIIRNVYKEGNFESLKLS